jgi:glycosyltransferase involved in cell wall biosynthesis
MNIVVFGNGAGFGGAQTAFRRLVDFLISEGHSVGTVSLAGEHEEFSGNGSAAFQSCIEYPESSRARKVAQTLRAALRARRHRPELFIAVGLANSANVVARLFPTGTFRVCQDFIFGRQRDDPLLRSAARSFDALAVQSPSMVAALRSQNYNALPLAYLPCFPNPIQGGSRRTRQSSGEQVRLGYFGRLAPNKGLDLLLRALASAKLSTNVSLDIWGRGGEEVTLNQLTSELKLEASVQFRGTYPSEGNNLIADYDGLVVPSTGLEGLPLVLLEAMAQGVPFLTTRVGAIPDCCAGNEDVVLVEPKVDALRSGLEQFVIRIATPDFSAKRLIQYYQDNFSFEVMADRWRAMIAEPRQFFAANA